MLLVRSLRDLIERRPLTWNLGAVGIAGPDLCNAAAREARDVFLTETSRRGEHLMIFGIQWLLEKHQRVVRNLLMAMPRNKAYANDIMLNNQLDSVENYFLGKWTRDFASDFDAQLSKATLNIQQFKIQRMLSNMGKGKQELRDLAVLLDPVPKDCNTLFDELIDSSVDNLVMYMGTEMYHMRHGTEGGFLKATDLATEMYNQLKGDKSDDYLAKAFPSLGQRRLLMERIKKTKASASEVTGAIVYFQDALTTGKNILASE